jgi:hypothetical protein
MIEIRFEYEGVGYLVEYETGETNRMLLPDGRLIVAKYWTNEAMPQPVGLYEEKYSLPDGLGIKEIANRLNAICAAAVM